MPRDLELPARVSALTDNDEFVSTDPADVSQSASFGSSFRTTLSVLATYLDTFYAKLALSPTQDQKEAMDAANAPATVNAFATIADLGAGSTPNANIGAGPGRFVDDVTASDILTLRSLSGGISVNTDDLSSTVTLTLNLAPETLVDHTAVSINTPASGGLTGGATIDASLSLAVGAMVMRSDESKTLGATIGVDMTERTEASGGTFTPNISEGACVTLTGVTATTIAAMTENGTFLINVPAAVAITLNVAYEDEGETQPSRASILVLCKVGSTLTANWQ